MPLGQRLRLAFADTPWTMSVIVIVLVVWLLDFFGLSAPMGLLAGQLDVSHAWRWLTYPLATPGVALWVFLGLFCFWMFSGSLERGWGTLRFGRVFVIVTLLSAVTVWAGVGLMMRSVPAAIAMAGLAYPAAALFMMWCSLNRESEILLMFVIPVKAKYIGLATIVLTFLNPAGPLAGLPFALFFAACWKWAETSSGFRPAVSGTASGGGLGQWWKSRKKAQRKGRFQVLEGGGAPSAVPTRVGSLKSMSKTPAPKDPEPVGKELDRILDKIRFEGMSALTEAERATLDSQSRRLRGDA